VKNRWLQRLALSSLCIFTDLDRFFIWFRLELQKKVSFRAMRFLIVFLFLFSGLAAARSAGESQVAAQINALRASGGRCNGSGGVKIGTMRWNNTLALAARNHAVNMGNKRFVSHYYQGVGPRTRVARAGYKYSRMSEIIFLGNGGASRATNWWKNSKIHCWAMTNPLYTEVGAAYYRGAWVVVMARPK
jgi:uncharacterized protein YkwD